MYNGKVVRNMKKTCKEHVKKTGGNKNEKD
jgi:hypothetical protein